MIFLVGHGGSAKAPVVCGGEASKKRPPSGVLAPNEGFKGIIVTRRGYYYRKNRRRQQLNTVFFLSPTTRSSNQSNSNTHPSSTSCRCVRAVKTSTSTPFGKGVTSTGATRWTACSSPPRRAARSAVCFSSTCSRPRIGRARIISGWRCGRGRRGRARPPRDGTCRETSPAWPSNGSAARYGRRGCISMFGGGSRSSFLTVRGMSGSL